MPGGPEVGERPSDAGAVLVVEVDVLVVVLLRLDVVWEVVRTIVVVEDSVVREEEERVVLEEDDVDDDEEE